VLGVVCFTGWEGANPVATLSCASWHWSQGSNPAACFMVQRETRRNAKSSVSLSPPPPLFTAPYKASNSGTKA